MANRLRRLVAVLVPLAIGRLGSFDTMDGVPG